MELRILKKEQLYKEAAEIFIDWVQKHPRAVLGLATGSTPVDMYKELIKANKEGRVSFKDVTTFNLDEYVGLDGTHDQSYRYFMNDNLFNHIDIDKKNTNVLLGVGDYEKFMNEYDNNIAKAGGIDIQLLGIGSDGHIAFNEPGTPFNSLTHIAELTDQTITDNARFFASKEDVPTKAVTMGLQSIMNARKIVLIATGKNKHEAVKHLLSGELDEAWPCTVLNNHKDVVIFVDEDAYNG